MEHELRKFKGEVESRFSKSEITRYEFPRNKNLDLIENITSVRKINNEFIQGKKLAIQGRSKTIDDYYEK